MAEFEPTFPLMKKCGGFGDDSDYEESIISSGYDSAVEEWSDSDSEDEEFMNSSLPDQMIFENTKPITNAIEYILSMPSLCDVEFVVGEDKCIIQGLKAVLASSNRIMHDMLTKENESAPLTDNKKKSSRFQIFKKKSAQSSCQTQKNKLSIVISNYEIDVFSRLISYLHLGEVSVTPETVVGLMCASEEFEIPRLEKACWDFCFRCISNGNVATIIQSSKVYQGREAADNLIFKLIGMVGGPKTTRV